MSTYTDQAEAFTKQVQWLIEIDLDRCNEDFGTGPCTASGADGSRCYYSYQTCQDLTNYDASTKTWRFCLNDVPWPDNATPAYPYLKKLVAVPQKIDPRKLYVFPEKIKAHMLADHNPPAPDVDKDSYNTGTDGEFWINFWARNRNYAGRPLRILRGFYSSGFAASDFVQVGPDYKMLNVEIKKGVCKITAESPLADLNKARVPWAISDDNTVQAEINGSVTEVVVRDGGEYPDPADYTRNTVYLQMDDEIVTLSSIAGDTLTIVRARAGTTGETHTVGTNVDHVAIFGTDEGSNAPSARNSIEIVQDLMEWAGVVAGNVDTDSFDDVKAGAWPSLDLCAVITKSATVAKYLQPLRETRGIIVYINAAGKWATTVMAPNASATLYDETDTILDSVTVNENEDSRITRVSFYYDPNTENPGSEARDYDKVAVVIDSTLENANNYDGKKESVVYDAWIDTALATSKIRNTARRMITRLRAGARTVTFKLDVKDGLLNVGDYIHFQSRLIVDATAAMEVRPCIVTARKETGLSKLEYQAVDINYCGRYLRIGSDTITDDYDTATAEERAFGYWGDSDNRVGATMAPGYIFW